MLAHVAAVGRIAGHIDDEGVGDGVVVRDELVKSIVFLRDQLVGRAAAVDCGSGARDDYQQLHDRLAELNDPQFERVVLQSGLDRSLISPPTAPLAMRAVEVARLARVDPALCRKLEQLLDSRPPPAGPIEFTAELGLVAEIVIVMRARR
ncbi:MAG: hypothetical protein E6J90_49380 [Deltaproteobacteria bacterium]|nr:MAG: hypothetical protein E6J90_49380 [Deltaproteobacteria bacterium]